MGAENGAPKREDGDDAYLEIDIWQNWNLYNNQICQRVGILKIDELSAAKTQLEDLDNATKLQRTIGQEAKCGESFFLKCKVKGDKGKEHFNKFNMDLLK